MSLRDRQRAYRTAKADFDALEAARDRLLEPIDSGERSILSPDERGELERIICAQAEVYPRLQATEVNLIQAARIYLIRHPAVLARQPALTPLTADRIAPGTWEAAVALAARLNASPEEGEPGA
jgi:hypothetical protein